MEIALMAEKIEGRDEGRGGAGVVAATAGLIIRAKAGDMTAFDQIIINPLMGVLTGLKAFVAAVLGGIGNIPGAVFGGLLIGLAEQLTAGYISPDYRDAITFVILILILLLKPEGLLGVVKQEKV